MAQWCLTGKVACVTGGGRGIGKAVALALAEAGADVCVAARSRDQLESVAEQIRALGRQALAVVCDMADPDAVQAMIDQAAGELGRLDILVNNAGGGAERKVVAESESDAWTHAVAVNLFGPYYASRAAIVHMARGGGGRIISIGSGLGQQARGGNTSYSVAKAGLHMFTRCLAMEVWSDGIDVNEVVPGPVYTELTKDVFDPTGGKPPPIAESERVKQPEECVPTIMFLAAHPPGGPTGQTFSLARRPL